MCAKCDTIAETIARYRWLKGHTTDHQALQAAEELVLRLETEKHALHSEERRG
jgi:hypothetical protein